MILAAFLLLDEIDAEPKGADLFGFRHQRYQISLFPEANQGNPQPSIRINSATSSRALQLRDIHMASAVLDR